jgi:FkbM family methyltransferase
MDINNFDWGWMENPEVTDLKPILIKEVFKDRIYERFFSVEEGDIVLDIGTSVGPFPYSILDKKPKHIYCLEPSSIEFSTLNKNLRGFPVTPIKKGIGEHNNGFYSDMVFGEINNEKTFIESINFATLLKDYSLDKIDFFKIDCEGGEYHVFTPEHLKFLKTIPKIAGEWHLQTEEEKILFRNFRDNILPNFNNYEILAVDGVDIKWDLWNEQFIEYYRQIIIYIDNR